MTDPRFREDDNIISGYAAKADRKVNIIYEQNTHHSSTQVNNWITTLHGHVNSWIYFWVAKYRHKTNARFKRYRIHRATKSTRKTDSVE